MTSEDKFEHVILVAHPPLLPKYFETMLNSPVSVLHNPTQRE